MTSKKEYLSPDVVVYLTYANVIMTSGEQLTGSNTNGYDNELDLLGGGNV